MCERLRISLLLLLGLTVATHAADVRVFVHYVSRAIAGYNAAAADDRSSPRACMDDCVVNKGVTNLRSLDWRRDGTVCNCQAVNFEEVSMSVNTDYVAYQYHATLTDVAAYSCRVTRGDMMHESHCEKLAVGAAFSDSVVIVEEGAFPFSSGQLVASRKQCTYLCLHDNTCNAYIIENSSAGFPANCILFYNL